MRQKYLHNQKECLVIYKLGGNERNVLLIFLLIWLKTNLKPLVMNHAQAV